MEKLNFANSTKNIPTPTEIIFKLQLIEKKELVIKNIRWKGIFYDMKVNKKQQQHEGQQQKQ